jgi:hypothetical protein
MWFEEDFNIYDLPLTINAGSSCFDSLLQDKRNKIIEIKTDSLKVFCMIDHFR